MKRTLIIFALVAAVISTAGVFTAVKLGAIETGQGLCTGYIMDHGAPVAGANILAYSAQSNTYTTTSAANGGFVLNGPLPPKGDGAPAGNYFFCASKAGRWYHTYFTYDGIHMVNLGTCSFQGGAHPGHPSW